MWIISLHSIQSDITFIYTNTQEEITMTFTNSFQQWATKELESNGYKVSYVGNWVRVNDELDIMSYQGVSSYIQARGES